MTYLLGKTIIDVEEKEFQKSDRETEEDVNNGVWMKFMNDSQDDVTNPSDSIDKLDGVQGGGDQSLQCVVVLLSF